MKGVRAYKRIGEQLFEETSDILNQKKRKGNVEDEVEEIKTATIDEAPMPKLPVSTSLPNFINTINASNITFTVQMH